MSGTGRDRDADRAPAVQIDDVGVTLGGSRVLSGVDVAVESGQFVGLVGPNGAGKTTLLRTVNARLRPDRGTVTVAGRPVAERSAKAVGRLVATVPQRTDLSFSLPVRTVVEMGRFPHRSRLAVADPGADRVEWAMERTEVAHLADRPVTEISGGERQRVLLARALAQDTPVLLLDEPTASLDVNHQVRTLSLVRELVDREDRTVIAAIHDLDLAARFCDELVLLAGGTVRASGPPESVLAEPTLSAAFETPTAVSRNPVTGTPSVTALPARTRGDRRGRVHVIGGGGRAGRLLHRLVGAGYAVSVGVIHEDDPDRAAARALDLDAVTVPPFADVDLSVDEARERAERADVTVLADVDVGAANVANLSVAAAADRLLVVAGRPFAQRNHAGEGAAERYAAIAGGATVVEPEDVVDAVADAVGASRTVAADADD